MPKVAKENSNQYAILGMLNHEPLTGYDLKKRMELTIGFFWPDLSYSKIYPTLKKMEKDKLVSMKEIEGENRPNRKVYSITKKGLSHLKRWLVRPLNTKSSNNLFIIMQELLLKVYLGNITSVEVTSMFINDSKSGIEQGNAMLKLFEKNLRNHLDKDDDHYYYLMTVLMGIDVTEAIIKWTSKAEKLLKELQQK